MTRVPVEIAARPRANHPEPADRPAVEAPSFLVIVADAEALTEGAACNDDNPYQG
ncbi:hypothetical protein [Streptomyces sp. NPDC090080]|uniref:hypothetical protein n=1 Tax=Streptomyces sp. NPDC090080 TaxID=3365939 RepID=UPI0037FEAE49